MRPAFDADGTALIGAFIPDEVDLDSLDESSLMRTRCSDFIRPRQVSASGRYNEVFSSGSGGGVRVGLPGIATVKGEFGTTAAVRADYELAGKLQADVDTAGLQRCCRAYPKQCSMRYVSQALKGRGSIYAATERAAGAGGEGQVPESSIPLGVQVFLKDGLKWQRTASFDGQYFAFGLSRYSTEAPPEKCSWANTPPQDLDGKYFIGVSNPMETEKDARDQAMRNAREQVVDYLGERITQKAVELQAVRGVSSALKTELNDLFLRERMSEGVARGVEMRDFCIEYGNTTTGTRWMSKVLAYFPDSQHKAALEASMLELKSSLKKKRLLTRELDSFINRMIASQ